MKFALFVCLFTVVLGKSDVGGVCGGNTANAQTCKPWLKCVPDNDTAGAPGDVGGHCHAVAGVGGSCGGNIQYPPVCVDGAVCSEGINGGTGGRCVCGVLSCPFLPFGCSFVNPSMSNGCKTTCGDVYCPPSDVGGVCGGNTVNARTCKAGLECVPDAAPGTGPAPGDVGGHCHAVSGRNGPCAGNMQYPPVCDTGLYCDTSNFNGFHGGTCRVCTRPSCDFPPQGCVYVNQTIMDGCLISCGTIQCADARACPLFVRECPDGTTRSHGPPPNCTIEDCDPVGCNRTSCPQGFRCNPSCEYNDEVISHCQPRDRTPHTSFDTCNQGCTSDSCDENERCNPVCVWDGLLMSDCQPAGIATQAPPYPTCALLGQSCGGFVRNPPVCKPGLRCQLPNTPDRPGVCVQD